MSGTQGLRLGALQFASDASGPSVEQPGDAQPVGNVPDRPRAFVVESANSPQFPQPATTPASCLAWAHSVPSQRAVSLYTRPVTAVLAGVRLAA